MRGVLACTHNTAAANATHLGSMPPFWLMLQLSYPPTGSHIGHNIPANSTEYATDAGLACQHTKTLDMPSLSRDFLQVLRWPHHDAVPAEKQPCTSHTSNSYYTTTAAGTC
jgi:hypothetical protein